MCPMKSTAIRPRSQQMTSPERADLIASLVEHMLKGLYSDNKLAELCQVDRRTITRYKPAAIKIIGATKIDRANVRALQIQRVYTRLERLNAEFETEMTLKERMAVHGQITKLEQHLALITGLNVETKINVDHKQLVITRAHPSAVKKAYKEATGIIDAQVVD